MSRAKNKSAGNRGIRVFMLRNVGIEVPSVFYNTSIFRMTPQVIFVGHCLEVIGINTSLIAANMVYFFIFGNCAFVKNKKESMRRNSDASHKKAAITVTIERSVPNPTSRYGVFLECVFECVKCGPRTIGPLSPSPHHILPS